MVICDALINFNLASAILFNARHNEIWTKIMKWVYPIIFLPSICITWSLWFQNVSIYYKNPAIPELGVKWDERNPEKVPWMHSLLYMFVLCIICAIWNVCWNAYALIAIIQRSYGNTSVLSINRSMLQKFLFSFYIFLLQLMTVIFVTFAKFFNLGDLLSLICYFLVDAIHFSVPWFFLFSQKYVKVAVLTTLARLFRMKKPMNNNQVTAMNEF
uniref:Serpentine receptor class gamma n=1 Tax=Panagrellus redivivus TaxID=6233 RepID=A0A7E5A1U9_PANRE